MATADQGGMVWKPLRYESLPWETHPIDIAIGPQGWGPFDGPYTPKDYITSQQAAAGMSGLNIGYNDAVFHTDHAPGYHDITIFPDRAQDSVNNILVQAQNEQYPAAPAYSSTIANALTRVNELGPGGRTGGAGELLQRLKSSLYASDK